MPGFSVLFTGVAGHLWLAGGFAASITLCLAGMAGLIVSLSHVAEAIEHATGTPTWPSRALAIAFEVGIVGLELGRVLSPGTVSHILGYTMTAALAALVGWLNVYAFRLHAYRVTEAP